MSESTRMMLGLVIGIAIMIVLVMKTKVHTFIALLLAALITGLIGGMPVADITNAAGETTVGVMTAIKDGFGNTLKSTGIIIGLGVMMGGILEVSGAAEQLAFTFIRVIGKRKEEWALAITGWVVSIPVFADSAIVIFAPLVKAMSSVTGISVVGLALSLACGLQLTHCLVPPTPGPLTAAGMLGVDVGQMIMVGAGISIPMLIVVVFYCKYIGKKIYQIPNENGHGYERKEFKKEYIKSMEEVEKLVGEKNLPSFTASILPIIIPIVLIFVKTFWGLFGTGEGVANTIISLVGEPIFALGVGTIIAIYGLVRKEDNKSYRYHGYSNQRYRYYHADHRSRRFSWKCNQSQRYRKCSWRDSCRTSASGNPDSIYHCSTDENRAWICNSSNHNSSIPDSTTDGSYQCIPNLTRSFLLCRSNFLLLLQ